jgi:serine/threonine-protein kinase
VTEPETRTQPESRRLTSAPLGAEDARRLLQSRIALFAKVSWLISLFFFVTGNVIALASIPGATLTLSAQARPNQLHFAAAAMTFVMWLIARSVRLSRESLLWLDTATVALPMAAYGGMALEGFSDPRERMDMLLLLIAMVVLNTRATVVPSSPKATALVSSFGMVPVVIVGFLTTRMFPDVPATIAIYNSLWAIVGVFTATFASHVIYGLRTKAAEARRLGQYLLGQKIGEGGMGTVYRARHMLMRRPTAIKLLPQARTGTESITRFEREVQHTSQLTHPNTVAIFDYGHTPDGVFYYAMEYLDGVNLQDLVTKTGPQSPSRVVHALVQACGSLAEAHSKGIVHRDIKPANIILCERGGIPDVVKVVDFGLAKDLSATGDPTLSRVDSILGTPLYMAPEAVASPASVDGRADLYSLGAVAYFLLTGQPVFSGDSVVEVCGHHLHKTPTPPSERLGSALPPDLEKLVLDCLAKSPSDRPTSALALRKRLLDCDVPSWSEDDAKKWWAEHADLLELRPIELADTVAESPTVLAVDFDDRAARR